jgi:hypothetical protein
VLVFSQVFRIISEEDVPLAVLHVHLDIFVLKRLFRNGFVGALINSPNLNAASWLISGLDAH